MQHKLFIITLFVLSNLLVGIQHNAKSIRDAVNPQSEIVLLTVNINKADAAEIAEVLVGVGLSKANLIVAHRKSNGPYKSLQELTEVKGIGPKTLEKNKAKITFE